MDFKNLDELYMRVTPALKTKMSEASSKHFKVTEEDIFNFLKYSKWIKTHDLTLADIVDDILKCDLYDVITYENSN